MLLPPLKSEFDPPQESEGSQDPLGLQPAYERIANRLLPAVTVRMGRPRFVTAMAVGARVCEAWKDQEIASDGVTPPWLVFEWYVVEAFVRAANELAQGSSIPGNQKIARAIRNGRQIGATTYLKTPTVFGYSGVYRRLAYHTGFLTDGGRLDQAGWELLGAWEKDQQLEGFIDGSKGVGQVFREDLTDAVSVGLARGHTVHKHSDFWSEIVRRLDPAMSGPSELKILREVITSKSGPIELVSEIKRALIAKGGIIDRAEEASFLQVLSRTAGTSLKQLIVAIDDYERFCRAITCAFDAVRYCAVLNKGTAVDAKMYQSIPAAQAAVSMLAPALKCLTSNDALNEWEREWLTEATEYFESVHSTSQLFETILTYHERVQERKPPDGKRPWFERLKPDTVFVRAGYLMKDEPETRPAYVHEYRLPTFSRFLADLGAYA